MTDYVLRAGESLELPRSIMHVKASGAAIVVEDPGVQRQRNNYIVVPSDIVGATVELAPPNGQNVFPADMAVGMIVSVLADGEQHIVRLGQVNLAGLGAIAALSITTVGDQWRLSCLLEGVTGHEGIVGKAQAIARGMGVAWPEGVAVTVGVDGSASISRAMSSGSLAAVIDVIVGVSNVIGSNRPPTVIYLGDKTVRFADQQTGLTPGEWVVAVRASGSPQLGVEFNPVETEAAKHDHHLAYLVTDCEPSIASGANGAWHVIILGDDTAKRRWNLDTVSVTGVGGTENIELSAEFSKAQSVMLQGFVEAILVGSRAAMEVAEGGGK